MRLMVLSFMEVFEITRNIWNKKMFLREVRRRRSCLFDKSYKKIEWEVGVMVLSFMEVFEVTQHIWEKKMFLRVMVLSFMVVLEVTHTIWEKKLFLREVIWRLNEVLEVTHNIWETKDVSERSYMQIEREVEVMVVS